MTTTPIPTPAELPALLGWAEVETMTDRDLVGVLRRLEELGAGLAALQARAAAALHARESSTVRSVGAQVGLARRESPHRGRELASFAVALVTDLPCTMAALAAGRISERRAMVVASEVADLSPDDRRLVDTEVLGEPGTLDGLGDVRVRWAVRRVVQRVDQDAAVRRRERAHARRRVSLRRDLACDGSGVVTGVVDDVAAVAIMTSLRARAEQVLAQRDPDEVRTREQIVADEFVARLTDQPTAAATPVALKLVVSAETLLGEDLTSAELEQVGPIPASVARRLVGAAPELRSTVQRLFRFEGSDSLVAMDGRSRCLTGQLREFVVHRDQGVCRTPWCNGPVRHVDHVTAAREGGETSEANAQGLCMACNLVKEHPGWRHAATGGALALARHRVAVTSPTGHHYVSQAPDPPPLPLPPPPVLEYRFVKYPRRNPRPRPGPGLG